MAKGRRFDKRHEIVAFPEVVQARGRMTFPLDVPCRAGVDRWLGRIHVVERLRGLVTLARIAEPSDKIRPLCTPPHHVLFGPQGVSRPGVFCRSGETLLFTFEFAEGPSIKFTAGVAFEPQGAGYFDMPGDRR